MKLTLSWLKENLCTATVDMITEALTDLGQQPVGIQDRSATP